MSELEMFDQIIAGAISKKVFVKWFTEKMKDSYSEGCNDGYYNAQCDLDDSFD